MPHCALCSNHGQHRNSMVLPSIVIKTDNETIKPVENTVYMLQNALLAMPSISDKLKPNSQPGGELTEPIRTNKNQNLTTTKAHF